jgi:hypothetical protein
MRFSTAVKMSIVVFWVVTPRSLVDGYKRFGAMYRLHLQGPFNPEDVGDTFLQNGDNHLTRLQGVTTQKTTRTN